MNLMNVSFKSKKVSVFTLDVSLHFKSVLIVALL